MLKRSAILNRIEAFCGRLNDGLAAVAVALAVVTTCAALVAHAPALEPLLQPIDTDTGVSLLAE